MTAIRGACLVLSASSLLLVASGCSKSHHALFTAAGGGTLSLEAVTASVTFPTFLTSPPGDHSRLFVTEKGGKIRILKNGVLLPTPFLDIHTLVSTGEEQGLLGLAFEPDYATSGRFLISYTDVNGAVQIVRYRVSPLNPDLAATTPVGTILSIPKTLAEHNGGMIAFGPDRMLWIGIGDGGGYGDPLHTGQTTDDLFGSILRIDVSNGTAGYAIPAGNPFTSPDRPEVWNIGLRNPWRWSFDRATGDLYIGDVGQEHHEEINVAPASRGRDPGANYGWSVLEGDQCFMASDCDRSGKTPPVIDYPHDPDCAVTGGYVYRGARIPALQGAYFYSDYCGHQIHSFRYAGGVATAETTYAALDPGAGVTSFGEDASGELYILTDAGRIYRIIAR
jgi:glucose/arabinose dehydrogenase